MTGPTDRRRFLAALALAAPLPGCAKLLTEPPRKLYRLTPKSTYPPGLPHISAQLLIDVPVAPHGLDTNRIALSRSPVSLDYFADSEWSDRVPLLVQTALVESFENSKAVTAIDREAIGLRADFVLKTELRHFEAVYAAPQAPPLVWVAINARVVKIPERTIIAQNSFERKEQVADNDIESIVLTFDEALGGVMKALVTWTVRNPALSARR